ncbi:MAG: hydrogenase maturation nickel metallochaperone HypA [Gammaproteobacteria bacterium]|nr:MAG: hydrogenase maturation nickel metallochaperone HypA [Gammaproteobacteria bacterium]
MHEMSLCESILDILEQQAGEQNYHKVSTVWLEIGALSSVESDAMRFCFDAVMQGSIADKARLEIVTVQGQAWCSLCNKNVMIEQRYDTCPVCGDFHLQINDGEQMRIKELEVE